MIVAYQPRVELRSLSKNGVSSKSVLEKRSKTYSCPSPSQKKPDFTPYDFYLQRSLKAVYSICLRCYNPFGSFENEFHRL
jgi:hypothetical protein